MRPDGRPAARRRLVIVGCGALARELLALTAGIPGVRVEGVDARLHMRPQPIADAVAAKVEKVRAARRRDVGIFVAYADCGTAGLPRRISRARGHRAHRGRPLLRVLRRRGGLRGAPGRGARDVLPDRLPGPPVRLDHLDRPRARPPSGAAADVLRELPPRSSTSPSPTTRISPRGPSRRRPPGARLRAPRDRLRRPRHVHPARRTAGAA